MRLSPSSGGTNEAGSSYRSIKMSLQNLNPSSCDAKHSAHFSCPAHVGDIVLYYLENDAVRKPGCKKLNNGKQKTFENTL